MSTTPNSKNSSKDGSDKGSDPKASNQLGSDTQHDAQIDADEQPFLEHLLELRQRILHALLAVMVLFFPIYYFANDLYTFVAEPLMRHLPAGATMIAIDVASGFFTPLKLALFLAVILGMPFILHQAWSFIAPGLYLKEKRLALPLLVSSIGLFYLGMAFAYYAVFPLAFGFFASVAPEGVTMMTDIRLYLNFVLKMFFAFGFAFEIPVATVLLAMTGFATADGMAAKRPYVIVGCTIAGMLLTPPDVISQLMLAVPTWLLFEVGVVFARIVEKRREAEELKEELKEES